MQSHPPAAFRQRRLAALDAGRPEAEGARAFGLDPFLPDATPAEHGGHVAGAAPARSAARR